MAASCTLLAPSVSAQPLLHQLDTPFVDLPRNHLLVLTDHLPPPRGNLIDEFTLAESSEAARLIVLTSGRTMMLFTARSRMQAVASHTRPLAEQYGLPVLVQGDAPLLVLVSRMKDQESTSLLALRSSGKG